VPINVTSVLEDWVKSTDLEPYRKLGGRAVIELALSGIAGSPPSKDRHRCRVDHNRRRATNVDQRRGGRGQPRGLVISYPTRAFLDMLAAAGQTFERVAASLQEAVTVHNRLETPLYAASIERRAIAASPS
jgi:hypothetical protein